MATRSRGQAATADGDLPGPWGRMIRKWRGSRSVRSKRRPSDRGLDSRALRLSPQGDSPSPRCHRASPVGSSGAGCGCVSGAGIAARRGLMAVAETTRPAHAPQPALKRRAIRTKTLGSRALCSWRGTTCAPSSRACRGISAVRVSERDPSTSLGMTNEQLGMTNEKGVGSRASPAWAVVVSLEVAPAGRRASPHCFATAISDGRQAAHILQDRWG
jgi:hypothetical protein